MPARSTQSAALPLLGLLLSAAVAGATTPCNFLTDVETHYASPLWTVTLKTPESFPLVNLFYSTPWDSDWGPILPHVNRSVTAGERLTFADHDGDGWLTSGDRILVWEENATDPAVGGPLIRLGVGANASALGYQVGLVLQDGFVRRCDNARPVDYSWLVVAVPVTAGALLLIVLAVRRR